MRQEVESGEDHTLRLDVQVELVVDALKVSVQLFQHVDDVGRSTDELKGLGIAVSLRVQLEESLVHLLENLGLIRQLLPDGTALENVLEVAPLLLHLEPLLDGRRKESQLLLDLVGLGAHDLDETVTENHIDFGKTFVEVGVHVLSATQDEAVVLLLVGFGHELNDLPVVLEVLQLVAELGLTSGFDALGDNLLVELSDVHVN